MSKPRDPESFQWDLSPWSFYLCSCFVSGKLKPLWPCCYSTLILGGWGQKHSRRDVLFWRQIGLQLLSENSVAWHKGLVRQDQELVFTLPCCCFSTPCQALCLHSCRLKLALPGYFLRPGLAAASQAQGSRDRPRQEQASLHSTTDFSASIPTAPFQSFSLFETEPQTQTRFAGIIIQVIKHLCFSVSSLPVRLKCFSVF